MTIEFEQYDRTPFSVNAKQITLGNIEELAQICGGTIEERDAKMLGAVVKLPVIRVKGTGDNRGKTFEATLGCWIVELKGSYRVYKEGQFKASFVKKPVPTDAELLQLATEAVKATTGVDVTESDLSAADCVA